MCDCAGLPAFVADLDYWEPGFPYAGRAHSAAYFRELDPSCLTPPLAPGGQAYRCTGCGQWWYVEGTPEETPSVGFALKLETDRAPADTALTAAKHSLAVVAHGGFDDGPCARAECPNLRLRGRALCHLHLGEFP